MPSTTLPLSGRVFPFLHGMGDIGSIGEEVDAAITKPEIRKKISLPDPSHRTRAKVK